MTMSTPMRSNIKGGSAGALNLIFMHTDQQHFQALSAFGCKSLHTPHMDTLAKRGVSFSLAYSANPVCCPARACWYTGRGASENGMLSNNHTLKPQIPDMGQWFSRHGYDCFYSGKWHVPGRNPNLSFNCITANPSGQGQHQDSLVAQSAQAFLQQYEGDKPFFLSLGFLQPHDCCYWVFTHHDAMGDLPVGIKPRDLPALPANFRHRQPEPKVVEQQFKGLYNDKRAWTELHWRLYLHDYYRMVEEVDAEIGRVLDALQASRYARNTVVVFMADHGDGLARRGLTSKWWLHDEAVRVPLVISAPNGAKARVDHEHVVSGLDIAPTLCDYAGIPSMPKARGRSLRPLVEQRSGEWREFVVSEAGITGRMLRTSEYKLIAYKNDPVVQLYDMRSDPWEMSNLAGNSKNTDTLRALQTRLADWEAHLEA